tara:strand:+ start:3778 stop:4566 length:789 start_codon:yes stop_codon:yes gene_type:complete
MNSLTTFYDFVSRKAEWTHYPFDLLCRNGLSMKIGNVHRVKFDWRFYGYRNFGNNHNSLWQRCIDCCKGKKIFVDMGAHIGLYTIPAAMAMKKSGIVVAFEPGQKNFHFLLKHIEYNKIINIQAYDYLIGDINAEVEFWEDLDRPNAMNAKIIYKKPERFFKVIKKQVIFDDFCQKHRIEPDIIKIDVKGGELSVFKGSEKTIRLVRPVIFLSVHPGRMEHIGDSVEELNELIDFIGYNVFDASMRPVNELKFGEYILLSRN